MQKHQQDAFESWAKFLNPESFRSNLIAASLFLAAYETLQNSIIDQPRSLYIRGFDQDRWIIDPKYKAKVLSRHKSPLRASLLWLREQEAIDDSDIELVDRIREHRNQIAHELPTLVATNDASINIDLIQSIYQVTTKVDRWWIREFEVPANPDFDDLDPGSIDDSEIISGNMIFLQLMIQMATGDDAAIKTIYDQFVQLVAKKLAAQRPDN